MNRLKIFSVICFFISTVVTFVIGELYFFSTTGMDFGKYLPYIQYFLNISETTGYGQGVLYYYLISFAIDFRSDLLSEINLSSYLSTSIQLVNFILYLFGLTGFFQILKSTIKTSTIFFAFTFLNFFPPAFEMRLLMKPEIVAFALLPWTILFIDNYFDDFKTKNLVFASATLSLIFSLKGSILGMIAIFLLFKYWTLIFANINKTIYPLGFFLFAYTLLSVENFIINDANILYHDSSLYTAWQNRASFNFLYHINKWDFYYFPISDYHSNSLIGITLLDTFGDYFNLIFQSDTNYFYHQRYTNFQDNFISKYSSQYAAIILGVLFYFLFFINFLKEKNYRIYLFAPLFGIAVLLINAFGFPNLNFDPMTGDTFKVHYYSFFLSVSYIFLVVSIFKKRTVLPIFFFTFISIGSIFTMGLIKSDVENLHHYLSYKNNTSLTCNLGKVLLTNKGNTDCEKPLNLCAYNLYSEKLEIDNLNEKKYKAGYTELLLVSSSKVYYPSSLEDCHQALESGYSINQNFYSKLRLPPLINLIYFLILVYGSYTIVKRTNE